MNDSAEWSIDSRDSQEIALAIESEASQLNDHWPPIEKAANYSADHLEAKKLHVHCCLVAKSGRTRPFDRSHR